MTCRPAAALSYPRLALADGRCRWWRPALVGVVTAAVYVGLLLTLVVVTVVVSIAVPSIRTAVDGSGELELDTGDPLGLAAALGSIALVLPALLVATRLVGARPVGLLWSVAGHLRRRWLASALVLALVVHVPGVMTMVVLQAATGELRLQRASLGTAVALLLVTLALVPLQAAAEELVFRGYLVQLVGSWLRHPALAVLLPVPLFVLSHGYDVLGTIDVAVFAVACGWLAWRTGGLEAPIAAHAVNNLLLASLPAVGVLATDGGLPGLVLSIVTTAAFAVLVARRADRLGVQRTRTTAARPAPVATCG